MNRPTIIMLICLIPLVVQAAEDEPTIADEAAKLKRVPFKTPAESIKAIQLKDGFTIEAVVNEPLVRDPVAVDFDENGRMYVVELPPYNSYVIEKFKHKGSIRLLEDLDDDGRYEKSTVFAADLNYPTALAVWDGGLFVGDSPHLYYFKDTDGDGKADERRVVLSGFGSDKAGEAHLNSIRWGIDQRFHLSTSLAGGDVRVSETEDGKATSVRGRGMILDPRDLSTFELTSGGGQHGMSMDDWGRKFVCSNSVPAQTLMYDDRYLTRNPHVKAPAAAVNIAPEGKFTKLFRISPPEPWRALRTRLRKTGKFRGSDEGGKPFGFFTGATGITIYRGDNWPAEYHGNLIVGDVANNLVYRATLEANGLSLIARRADSGREFLASADIWFRPVQFANAPDGTLYVLDMYRELIEGAAFLPPEFLDHIDAVSGFDRGRIYRIAHSGTKRRSLPKLGTASTAELVSLIEHANGWLRDTASRLLYRRQDRAAVVPLRKLIADSKSPIGRATALHLLNRLSQLDENSLLAGLSDADANVRAQAVRIAEGYVELARVSDRLLQMVNDDSLIVRYQLAFSLGALNGTARNNALASLLVRDVKSSWTRMAIQTSLARDAGTQFRFGKKLASSEEGRAFLTTLAGQIGATGRTNEIVDVVRFLDQLPKDQQAFREKIVSALAGSRTGEEREKLLAAAGGQASDILKGMLSEAKSKAADEELKAADRAAAVRTLKLSRFDGEFELLVELLSQRQPQPVQQAVLEVLAEFRDDRTAELIIDAWSGLSPALRPHAAETLFLSESGTRQFLKAVANETIPRSDIDSGRVALLRKHPNEALRKLVASTFPESVASKRKDIVEAYQPALKLQGNGDRGRMVFRKNCSACHRLEEHGTAIGADLKAVSDRGNASVLLNILDPNREVKPKYLSYVLSTDRGQILSGMIVAENATSITIRRPDGMQIAVQRQQIDELKGTGLSFMPEGLEKKIDKQAMADLLAYLESFR